jgi:prophage regulatory protein
MLDEEKNETAPTRILRLPDVINRVGLKRASIYAAIAQGSFPKQITLGDRAVGWIEQEIEAWLEARIRISNRRPLA